MSYDSDDRSTLEMAGTGSSSWCECPPMPPSQGPPTPSGSPPSGSLAPARWLAPPPLPVPETRAVLVGGPWEVQPGGGQFTDQLVELPLRHDGYSDTDGEEDDDVVSEVGSSVATAADPADEVLNPWDFIVNVLHTWGPKPEDYSPLILRDYNGDDFWADYPLPTFSPTEESWWEAYLTECGLQRVYLRRFWMDRRAYSFEVTPAGLHQDRCDD